MFARGAEVRHHDYSQLAEVWMEKLNFVLEWLQSNPVLFTQVLIGSVVLAGVYAVGIFVAIARMNPDYFAHDGHSIPTGWKRHPFLWLLVRIIKNMIGSVLLLLGAAMLILPGQGVLTILIGISLLDFPGKRRLELYIVLRPAIRRTIDRIRHKAGSKPLNLPEP